MKVGQMFQRDGIWYEFLGFSDQGRMRVKRCPSPEYRLLHELYGQSITMPSGPPTIDARPVQKPREGGLATGSAAIAETVTDLLHRRDERGLGRPWSIAELGLQTDDFQNLSVWAAELDGRTVRHWLGNWWTFEAFPGGGCYSRQACLGLLLLTFAAEAARRQATEGTLWPHVRRDDSGTLRFGSDVDLELFDYSGQPTSAYKNAIEAAAQTFGLRNLLEDLDSPRYYLTVFLQFGFTIRDARLRLGQWLTGAPVQAATHHLLAIEDPLHSPGFGRMWEILKNSRASNPPPASVAVQLAESPWVLREWAGELPGIAARDVPRPAGNPAEFEGGTDAILSEPKLRWSPPDPPYFICRLQNLATAGLVAPKYDLRVAGRRLTRISRGEDGAYCAAAEEIVLPDVVSGAEAQLVEREGGEVAATLALTCFDPYENVVVFELPSGRRLGPDERLKSSREYALMFAPDLALDPPGASWAAMASGRFRIETLAGLDVTKARLISDGDVFWTPPTSGLPKQAPAWAHIDARVEGAPGGLLPLGGSYRLAVRHDVDVEIVYARCRMEPVRVSGEAPGTTCAGPVTSPTVATGLVPGGQRIGTMAWRLWAMRTPPEWPPYSDGSGLRY
jgi:hypothetical protein